jgi:hypothetical protein
LAGAFCAASETWSEDTRSLEAIVKCDRDAMDLLHLGYALFENGWLGSSQDLVQVRGDLGLGDIGYIAEDNLFIVVDNLHTFLASANGTDLTWTSSRRSGFPSTSEDPELVDHIGKPYNRQVCMLFSTAVF